MSKIQQYFIRKQYKRRFQQPNPDEAWLGKLGDGHGNVVVPTNTNYRYVRPIGSDQVMVVHKGAASDIENAHVWVGRHAYRPDVLTILALDPTISQAVAGIESHSTSHYLDGSDPVFIDTRQITTLLAVPGGTSVTVYGGWVLINGTPVHVTQQTLDLSSNIPVTGALWGLIRVSSAGVIDLQEGTALDAYLDLQFVAPPTIATGYAALWGVKLYAGQENISRMTNAPDLVDLRFAPRVHKLETLSNVVITSPADDEILAYDNASGDWINQTAAEAGLSDTSHNHKLDDLLAPDDNTDLNASTLKHGLLPKLSGNTSEALLGDGTFGEVSTGGGGGGGSELDLGWELISPSVDTNVGVPIVASQDFVIDRVILYVDTPGSAGSTTVDVNLNGVSIFSTNPTVPYDDADKKDDVDVNTVVIAGDILTLDIDSLATDADRIRVLIVPAGYSSGTMTIWAAEVLVDETASAGGLASVTITVPSDCSKLEIDVTGKSEKAADGDYLAAEINGDGTAGNYMWGRHYAADAGHAYSESHSPYLAAFAFTNATYDACSIHSEIMNPCGGQFRKIFITNLTLWIGADDIEVEQNSMIWYNTSAITSIVLAMNSGEDFAEGSRVIVTAWREITIPINFSSLSHPPLRVLIRNFFR